MQGEAFSSWPPGGGEMARRIRERDWAVTPLGPIAGWPAGLRAVVDLLLPHPFPMCVLWGADLIQIYNDGYAGLIGGKHPACLGRPLHEQLPEVRHLNQPLMERVWAGEALQVTDQLYPAARRGAEIEDGWYTATYSPVRDAVGGVGGVLVTAFETTERVLNQKALRASEERYRAFVTASTDVVYRMSADWSQMRQLDGKGFIVDTADASEDWVERYILPDDHRSVRAAIDHAIRTKTIFELEHRVLRADGSAGWTMSRAMPILGEHGEVVEWLGAASDVTTRKEAETCLREREAELAQVQHIAGVGGLKVDIVDNLMGWRSPEYLRLHGLPAGVLDEPHEMWLARVHPDDRQRAERALFDALNGDGDIYENEYRILRPSDGELRWISVRSNIERDAGGKPLRLLGAHIDVTERMLAEAASRKAEKRYLALFNAIDQGFCTVEVSFDAQDQAVDYRFLEVSPSFELQTGIVNAAGRWMRDIAPDQDQHWFDVYGDVARTGKPTQFENFSTPLDRWWEVFAFRIGEPGEHTIGILFRDITDRKRIETELRERQERQAFLLELSDRLGAVQDAKAAMSAAAEMFARRLGLAVAHYLLFDPDEESFEVAGGYSDGRLPEELTERSGQISDHGPGWGPQFRNGEAVFSDDHDARPAADAAASRALGVRSGSAVPLIRDGKLVAMFSTASPEPRQWTEAEKVLQREVAERTWAAVDLARADTARRESEERLRQFGEASQDVLWIRDADTFQWEYLTPAFETIYGLDRAAALSGDNLVGWSELILPEDREHALESIRRVHDGEWVTFEYRIRRPTDGEIRWLRDTDFPITDAAGRVAHIGGIGHDITTLKEAEERVRGSEARLRLALHVAQMATWDWNLLTDEVQWSDQHYRLGGYEVGEVQPSYEAWISRVHPDDLKAVDLTLVSARDRHLPYAVEFRSLHPDGVILWLSAVGRFFYGANGQPIRMIGVMQDVTEQRAWKDRQQALVAELQHRTRNLMAVIRAIADKTARSRSNLTDFLDDFRDRLAALARVQGLLSRINENDRVTFDELIETELAAMNGNAERVTVEGPKGVRLRSSMVQTLALALHELATNAVKYGALGQSDASLTIRWTLVREGPAEQPWLHIDWRETGVALPPEGASRKTGQGRELIERALPYQLGAKTRYQLGPDGLHCTISIPVSASPQLEEAEYA